MHLNIVAILIISFLPLLSGYLWYSPSSVISNLTGYKNNAILKFKALHILKLYILSILLVVGYANLIIHQLGFYELFMTDIIKGNADYQILVDEFMAEYGHKHRHFGHGVFHGGIVAVLFSFPYVVLSQILEQKDNNYFKHHLSYWVITSMIIGGFIAQFV